MEHASDISKLKSTDAAVDTPANGVNSTTNSAAQSASSKYFNFKPEISNTRRIAGSEHHSTGTIAYHRRESTGT
ncbi:hypothetical protein MTO96_043840 [Rhipicephalus appendiculatus]